MSTNLLLLTLLLPWQRHGDVSALLTDSWLVG